MTLTFTPATKSQAKARVALIGPSGSGKTYTALTLATALGDRVAVIDTEHDSALKYAGIFDFHHTSLPTFDPRTYIQAIQAADAEGFDVLVIDSMSHEWEGVGGVLELHDRATAEDRSKNSFAAWRKVTPLHNQFIEAILASRLHVIGTMRSKSEYSVEGSKVSKVGTAPKQRDGVEYEFDVVADLELDNTMRVTKSRCPDLHRKSFAPAGPQVAATLKAWLSDGQPQNSAVQAAPTGATERGRLGESGATHPADSPAAARAEGEAAAPPAGDKVNPLEAFKGICGDLEMTASQGKDYLVGLGEEWSDLNVAGWSRAIGRTWDAARLQEAQTALWAQFGPDGAAHTDGGAE